MAIDELWVERHDLRKTRLVSREAVALADGEIRVSIDKFGLTANNVSYGLSGEMIGYWKYFPAEAEWGKVPVWGFGDVVESRSVEIPAGERMWGFFPIATEVTLRPGSVNDETFLDFAAHRQELPGLYNQYLRTGGDPDWLRAMEDERCLLFPLFTTSFVLYDYLVYHDFFAADQVLIGSASSKTGFGLAHLLHHDAAVRQKVVGLTSASNREFVEGLGVYDQVVPYPDVATLDGSVGTVFVDMAGSAAVIAAVHTRFGDSLKKSSMVGATHWDAERRFDALPGPAPKFFFAPAHIAKRDAEWGPGAVLLRGFEASAKIARDVAGRIGVSRENGPAAVERAWRALVANEVPPSRGLMLSMRA